MSTARGYAERRTQRALQELRKMSTKDILRQASDGSSPRERKARHAPKNGNRVRAGKASGLGTLSPERRREIARMGGLSKKPRKRPRSYRFTDEEAMVLEERARVVAERLAELAVNPDHYKHQLQADVVKVAVTTALTIVIAGTASVPVRIRAAKTLLRHFMKPGSISDASALPLAEQWLRSLREDALKAQDAGCNPSRHNR
jgi:hypothetical protein